jgi:putative addiction module CopG family antidote
MDVTIPKSLEALVRRKVDEPHYSTEDEVVADALRLMQARDEVAEIKRARLKDAIERGYEDAAVRIIRTRRSHPSQQLNSTLINQLSKLLADRLNSPTTPKTRPVVAIAWQLNHNIVG